MTIVVADFGLAGIMSINEDKTNDQDQNNNGNKTSNSNLLSTRPPPPKKRLVTLYIAIFMSNLPNFSYQLTGQYPVHSSKHFTFFFTGQLLLVRHIGWLLKC